MKRAMIWSSWAFSLLVAMVAINTYLVIGAGLRISDVAVGDYMMRIVKGPATLWAFTVAVIGLLAWTAQAAQAAEANAQATVDAGRQAEAAAAEEDLAKRRNLTVQLVGAQLFTPYITRGLPLQAQLPTVLNRNPLKKPKAFYAPAIGERPLGMFFTHYVGNLIRPFETPFWVQRPKYKYAGTSFFYNGLKWTQVSGNRDGKTKPETDNEIPVFMTLPKAIQPLAEPPVLDAEGRRLAPFGFPQNGPNYDLEYKAMLEGFSQFDWVNFELLNKLCAFIGNKHFGHHPVYYRFGGASTGFTSLEAAFTYLEAHPQEVVWLMAVDAPSYGPNGIYRQPNEGGILLMLAHQDFDTGREPLAMIHRVARATEADGKTTIQRLRAVIREALDRASVKPEAIGRYFHDAAGGADLALAARGATEGLPHFAWDKQNYSLPAWLGETGALTTPYHLLLASWAAHTEGKPMLVVNVRDTQDALVVTPPEHYTPVDTTQPYWAARSENDFSRPWWGRRKDGKPDVGMSPMVKDDNVTPAKPAPVYELKYE